MRIETRKQYSIFKRILVSEKLCVKRIFQKTEHRIGQISVVGWVIPVMGSVDIMRYFI